MSTQLEDTKRIADAEANDRSSLLTKFKNLASECERLKMLIEEEAEKKNDYVKALSKAQADIQLWKSKFEVEACGKIEELESSKQKINTHAFETEEQIESLNTKIAQNEKSINRLEVQLDEILIECERTEATISEKRGSNSEKVLNEWKVKAEDLALVLVLEAVRSKAAKEDSIDQLNITGMVSVKYYWVLQMFF